VLSLDRLSSDRVAGAPCPKGTRVTAPSESTAAKPNVNNEYRAPLGRLYIPVVLLATLLKRTRLFSARLSSRRAPDRKEALTVLLLLGMIVLGLATFAAMLAFVELCDRV